MFTMSRATHLAGDYVWRKTVEAISRAAMTLEAATSAKNPQLIKPLTFLALWFVTNVFITIYSKSLFKDLNFPYPMLLTAIHLSFTWLMALTVGLWRRVSGVYTKRDGSDRWLQRCLVFSLIFTTNIWLSNYSLLVVTINVHQIIRTAIPLLTMVFSWTIFGERYPLRLLPSVIVVILGVLLTVWSDRIAIGIYGLTVVLAGCIFSSLKGIMTRNVQLELDTIDVLRIVSPVSVVLLLSASLLTGELSAARAQYDHRLTNTLLIQGATAALLNYVSFKCAALNTPLTMNIAGNVKQVVTPLFATLVLRTRISPSGYAGIAVAFTGAVWYTMLINRYRENKQLIPPEPPTETKNNVELTSASPV